MTNSNFAPGFCFQIKSVLVLFESTSAANDHIVFLYFLFIFYTYIFIYLYFIYYIFKGVKLYHSPLRIHKLEGVLQPRWHMIIPMFGNWLASGWFSAWSETETTESSVHAHACVCLCVCVYAHTSDGMPNCPSPAFGPCLPPDYLVVNKWTTSSGAASESSSISAYGFWDRSPNVLLKITRLWPPLES